MRREPPAGMGRVPIGDNSGSADYEYYLYADGTVWRLTSPNKMSQRGGWEEVPESMWDRLTVEGGKTIRQQAEEARRSAQEG